MTQKEQTVQYHKCSVREQESKVREARSNLSHGYEKLKAEMDKEYARLKFELEREEIRLDQAKSYLLLAEADLVRGFDTST